MRGENAKAGEGRPNWGAHAVTKRGGATRQERRDTETRKYEKRRNEPLPTDKRCVWVLTSRTKIDARFCRGRDREAVDQTKANESRERR